MALFKEEVKDIKLIFKENDGFIPKIWVRKNFPNGGYTHNHSVYIWSLDCIQHVRYSLHFVCYLAKFIMKPKCCDGTIKEVGTTWMNNLLDTSFTGHIFPHAQRLEKFLLDNIKTVEMINLKLEEIKQEIPANETVFSKLNSIPTSLLPSQQKMCFTCGEVRYKERACEKCIQHNIIILEIAHRPECWNCLTASLYISNPIVVNPLKRYVFTIDLKKRSAMMGWERRRHTQYNLRSETESEDDGIQQNRPLAIMWSVLDVFEECSARVKTPTLYNTTKFYVLTNFDVDKLHNHIPQFILKDVKSLGRKLKKFTTAYRIF